MPGARPARSQEDRRARRLRSVAVGSACATAAAGFELCARRTSDVRVAVAATSAATFLRTLSAATAAGSKRRRSRTRTCERLRWEWLASTATILDGAPDARLVRECARILSDVSLAGGLPEPIVARFRVALAEAHSLASAIEQMRSPSPQPVAAYA